MYLFLNRCALVWVVFILLHDQIWYRRPFVSVFVENTGFSLWIVPPSTAWKHRVDTILKRKKKHWKLLKMSFSWTRYRIWAITRVIFYWKALRGNGSPFCLSFVWPSFKLQVSSVLSRFFHAMSRNYFMFPWNFFEPPDSQQNFHIPGEILLFSRNRPC